MGARARLRAAGAARGRGLRRAVAVLRCVAARVQPAGESNYMCARAASVRKTHVIARIPTESRTLPSPTLPPVSRQMFGGESAPSAVLSTQMLIVPNAASPLHSPQRWRPSPRPGV